MPNLILEKSEEQSDLFLKAFVKKDYDTMQKALDLGADIDHQNVRGASALMGAVLAENVDVKLVKWLLDRHASPLVKNRVGDTPLHEAAKKEDSQFIQLLLSKTDNPDVVNNLRSSPLMEACAARRIQNVKALLNAKADTSLKSDQGTSALLNAAMRHDNEIVEMLLKAGANVNDADSYGVTALISAAQLLSRFDQAESEAKSIRVIKTLLKAGANPNQKANSGNSPIAEAANCLNRKVVLELLNWNADPNVHSTSGVRGQLTPLMVAAIKHDVEVVHKLLEHHADANFKNDKGENALQLVFNSGISDEKDRLAVIDCIEEILSHGGELDNSNMHGLAHYGVLIDAPSLIDKAKQLGTINQQDKEGHTALHVALFTCKEKMALHLIEAGADVNLRDKAGNSPLSVLASRPIPQQVVQIIQLLLQQPDEKKRKEGERLKKELDESWIKTANALINGGATVDSQNEKGQSALTVALMTYSNGQSDMALMDLLLKNGARIELRDEQSDSPFIWALKVGNKDLSINWAQLLIDKGLGEEVTKALIDVCWTAPEHPDAVAALRPVFEALIEKGAQVNYQDEDGQTPLIVAAATNQEEMVNLLLDLGADPNLKNNEGEVPAAQAIANNHPNITNILLTRGANPLARNKEGEDLTALAYRHQRSSVINQLAEAKEKQRQTEEAVPLTSKRKAF